MNSAGEGGKEEGASVGEGFEGAEMGWQVECPQRTEQQAADEGGEGREETTGRPSPAEEVGAETGKESGGSKEEPSPDTGRGTPSPEPRVEAAGEEGRRESSRPS